MKKYEVEILCLYDLSKTLSEKKCISHIFEIWADNKDEAKEKGESLVFEEFINFKRGDFIRGYKIKKIK